MLPSTTSLPKTIGLNENKSALKKPGLSGSGIKLLGVQLLAVYTLWSPALPIQSWSAACAQGLSTVKQAKTAVAPLMAAERNGLVFDFMVFWYGGLGFGGVVFERFYNSLWWKKGSAGLPQGQKPSQRRRRSSPAPNSNPASALVGSGTAVQERVLPELVKLK